MVFSGEQAGVIDYPVGRNVFRTAMQGPSHHPRTRFQPEVMSNSPVARNPAFRNQSNHVIHILKEIIGRLVLFVTLHTLML